MRVNDLHERCKTCQNLKAWGLDMGGNHLITCKKSSWNLEKEECEEYEAEEADEDNEWEY
jgi:hypothetical protein